MVKKTYDELIYFCRLQLPENPPAGQGGSQAEEGGISATDGYRRARRALTAAAAVTDTDTKTRVWE